MKKVWKWKEHCIDRIHGNRKDCGGNPARSEDGPEFVDTDKEIERITGMTIRDIFYKSGETRFRSENPWSLNSWQIKRNGYSHRGRAVINPENLKLLKINGILVCLEANPEYSRR